MFVNTIRYINVGIYVPNFASNNAIGLTLASLNYGNSFPIKHCFLYQDGQRDDLFPSVSSIQCMRSKKRLGKAHHFNHLIQTQDCDAFLFIEAGVEIDITNILRLLIHLNKHPEHGMVGPGTNQSELVKGGPNQFGLKTKQDINEQCYAHAPNNSLSNFCYLLRKEVVDIIGAADLSYSSQNYWTLDYNMRALLKGFDNVFLPHVYAPRNLTWPNESTDADKIYFNSKFNDFVLNSNDLSNTSDSGLIHRKFEPVFYRSGIDLDKTPLVSCILPTANRPAFIIQSIAYFNQQLYPHKELVIVYNESSDLPLNIPMSDEIRLIKTNEKSIGSKRNIACQNALGDIIAQWDDDDLYHPERLSAQIEPILAGECDITALGNTHFFGLSDWSFWKCSKPLHSMIFANDVAGGTLVYIKKIWAIAGQYPDTSLREDADFLMKAMQRNARLKKLDGSELFAYLRHDSNSWKFKLGKYVSAASWIKCDEFDLVKKQRVFYKQQQEVVLAHQVNSQALVSCIMPTYNRSQFVIKAIKRFLNQNYSNKELIIMDDGSDSIEHLIPNLPEIKYYRLHHKHTLGAKRNLCCENALGDIIVHWDDDDWYANDWILHQVSVLAESEADICGLSNLYFYAPISSSTWEYQYPDRERKWVAGATMAYRRGFWANNKFPDINIGEDNAFVWRHGSKVISHNYKNGFVAIVHPTNTSQKHTQDPRWKTVDNDTIFQVIGSDFIDLKYLLQPVSSISNY